jgi:hypothetical protein
MEGPPLPARVLDPFFGSEDWLGPSARVEGSLALVQAGASDWQAEFQGTLLDVDLGTLVGRHFPDHRLAGTARVAIAKARWAPRARAPGSGWVEAEGEVASGPGTIGMGLVQALRSELKFQTSPRHARRQSDLPFSGLAFRFALTPDGEIRLGGGFGAEFRPGVVLVDSQREEALIWAPEGASNVLGLVNALVPRRDDSILVSGGAEAQGLQVYLPLPASRTRGEALHSN